MILLRSDARHIPLKDGSVQCVVTSPPYWGLRDYGLEPTVWGGDEDCEHRWVDATYVRNNDQTAGEKQSIQVAFCSVCNAWLGTFGLEPSPEQYVENLVGIFREVRRVLRDDGTLWLNIGDSYATGAGGGQVPGGGGQGARWKRETGHWQPNRLKIRGLKPKDLIGIPWRVAFALQADGWWLRSDIVWAKKNPIPESVKDRPTRSHEYLFLMTRSAKYYYDADAIREPFQTDPKFDYPGRAKILGRGSQAYPGSHQDKTGGFPPRHLPGNQQDGQGKGYSMPEKWSNFMGRNKRTVWTIAVEPVKHAHFSTFPRALVEPCILAGSREGDIVLDPFCGSGTVVRVAEQNNRRAVGADLAFHDIAKERSSRIQRNLSGLGRGEE